MQFRAISTANENEFIMAVFEGDELKGATPVKMEPGATPLEWANIALFTASTYFVFEDLREAGRLRPSTEPPLYVDAALLGEARCSL